LAGKIERILIPTVMIQGGSDFCDEPSSSEGFDRYFDGGYRRLLLENIGHLSPREAPKEVTKTILETSGLNAISPLGSE